MPIVDEISGDVNQIITNYGMLARFKYYATTFSTGSYDDEPALTYASTGSIIWASGLFQPLSNSTNSSEAQYVEAGQLLMNDSKFYVNGSIPTSGIVKIGLGSPVRQEYEVLPMGTTVWEINGSPAFKKVFVRALVNGSLIGE